MGVKLFGDWGKIQQVATLAARFRKASDKALLLEAHKLRGDIITGIASGAPGGQQFASLSPITLALRAARGFGGTKPMVVTGTLRGNVVVHRAENGVFVGLLRQAQAKTGGSLANIGAIHEFGRSWTMTAKQRRFIFAVLRKAGLKGGASRTSSGGAKIRIPARPFVGPVFDKERPHIVRRFWDAVAKGVGYDLGRPH